MNTTHPFTTTAFELAGYRIVKNFGVVRGIVVRSRSLCEHTRDDAFRDMIAHANELNANAVIGVRYDATELAQGITEVLCYGTAVQVEPATAS
jgi:uncharacterized protein YbjQ (UPF0145 family)